MTDKIDTTRTAEIRAETGCSLFEAHRLATQERLQRCLSRARTVEDMRPILAELITRVFGK